ncbi:GTP-binding protein Rho1 [Coemansia sp. BCRC 34490]|nr:GTP-binding protein Rho1 [Coemansia sp. Benny D160-2]KAJ2494729.1 GTP-binding protein Rho1 [Coemansia sp. RSA 2049]KAJ2504383.1 GTP-binding protein Rho1 [Coemansia sp. RSA 1939]KAJ2586705.1 GTP-binding protein Rho1 [Coemansia sp. RSA 1804]KAJ2758192.1 GTP-binding protein Rho1 [Coemansia sp. BCRC 34490]
MAAQTPIKRKAVIIGDGGCGKTCLLHVYREGEFPPDDQYIPTIFEEWVSEVHVDGRAVELALWDTAGQEDYDNVRYPCYNGANVVVICFSVDSPDSLENVQEKWIREVLEYAGKVPTLLVGLKEDLRHNQEIVQQLQRDGQSPTTRDQALEVARAIGAHMYLECSAKENRGVKEVFTAAIKSTLKPQKNYNYSDDSCCAIL